MRTFRATFTPLSAFGTPLKGDTFFGQLCWAVRNRFGEARLTELLQGYTTGQPFAVVSDAFPAGHLPRPVLPGHLFEELPGEDRKAVKKRAWMPLEKFAAPLAQWLAHCVQPGALPGGSMQPHPQPHNTISRRTGTTGEGAFAPYTMEQLWYGKKPESRKEAFVLAKLDVYFVLDEEHLSADELETLISDICVLGFGRDASIGLGKFHLDGFGPCELPCHDGADAWLTLAPCAPQGLGFDPTRCFYQTFTRFGRHGDIGVHFGNPFKTPILLAQAGAVLSPP
ncbi:MAG TPA: CRISPR-associated protein Csm7, partial [Methylococcus sp.]|nr:CRISPR-associated protein Csm7 [Methylococcus sp.]